MRLSRVRFLSLAGTALIWQHQGSPVRLLWSPLFWVFEAAFIVGAMVPTTDGITTLLLNGLFGAAALGMLWKYIQQTGENDRRREENTQKFLDRITEGLDQNTKATNQLSSQFERWAFQREWDNKREP